MKALIFCAGEAERWRHPEGVGKHWVEIDGEPLLVRTLRQLKSRAIDPVVVCRAGFKVPVGEECFQLVGPVDTLCADILRTEPLWTDRTWVLLGDVFFTDELLDQMLDYQQGLHFFGRFGASPRTGGPGEVFSFAWDGPNGRLVEALQVAVADAAKLPPGLPSYEYASLWQPYRWLAGGHMHQHTQHVHWNDKGIWVEQPHLDWSDDFDSYDRFQRFEKRYASRSVIIECH